MYFLSYLLHIGYTLILVNSINGYVLFAANIDDFRTIAKKFVPERLADKLADMASETSMMYKKQPKIETDASYDAIDKDNSYETDEKEISKETIANFREKDDGDYIIPKINLDELVAKVKEKLDEEYKSKLNENKVKQVIKNMQDRDIEKSVNDRPMEVTNDYELNEKEVNDEIPSIMTQDQTETTPVYYDDEADYNNTKLDEKYDNIPLDNVAERVDDEKPFEEFNMAAKGKNDSYEDYVTPEKEDNIFESEEVTENITPETINYEITEKYQPHIINIKVTDRFKPQTVRYELKSAKKDVKPFIDLKRDYELAETEPTLKEYDVTNEPEIKAKTENLWYDYNEKTNETITEMTTQDQKNQKKLKIKKKKGGGTMIPTRQTYKISSPNYYAKLPVVAEKYNFDEPLPEKDREPEVFKGILSQPASINRKVKI